MALGVNNYAGQRNVFERALIDNFEAKLREHATEKEWARWQQYKSLMPVLRQPDPLPMLIKAADSGLRSETITKNDQTLLATGTAVTFLAIAAPEILIASALFLAAIGCSDDSVNVMAGDDTYQDIRSSDTLEDDALGEIDIRSPGELVSQEAYEQPIGPRYLDCFLFAPYTYYAPYENDELMVAFFDTEGDFNNFYKAVYIYSDKGLSNEKKTYVMAQISKASNFVQLFTGEYMKVPPRYETLEVFIRPPQQGDPLPEFAGAAIGNQISMTMAINVNDDGSIPAYYATLVHEMLHTYMAPEVAEEQNSICSEGISGVSTHSLDAYASGNDFTLGNILFPPEPVEPLFIGFMEDGSQKEFGDSDQHTHVIKVAAENGASHEVLLDDVPYPVVTGYCEKKEYFVCANVKKNGIDIAVFDSDETGKQAIVPSLPMIKKKKYDLDISAIYTLWGYDENGGGRLYSSGSFYDTSVGFVFPVSGYLKPSGYMAAYGLMLYLQQMYQSAHPERHPNDFLQVIGKVHNDYVQDQCENGYHPAETNIYHRFCERMDVGLDECLEIFEAFGLDTNLFLEPI